MFTLIGELIAGSENKKPRGHAAKVPPKGGGMEEKEDGTRSWGNAFQQRSR